jgi:hypothetical protein
VLALADKYTPSRLEAACTRGLTFGDASLPALKRILAENLDTYVFPPPAAPAPTDAPLIFARPAHELAEAILGGATWN